MRKRNAGMRALRLSLRPASPDTARLCSRSIAPMASLSASPALPRVVLPALFVLLWSTGFVGAKLGLPQAGPLTFLSLRFALATGLMLVICLATDAPWPKDWRGAAHIAVVGVLLQGIYLGGVFTGIAEGVGAGLAALIVGLQPALTAALASPLLGERVSLRQWLGVALGLVGVALVVKDKLAFDHAHLMGALAVALALVGITVGTLYQKRFGGHMDLRTGTVIQNAVAAALVLPGAWEFESFRIAWSGSFLFALAWLVLVLSLGATLLLFALLRQGAASEVAGLFYLVPPVTALMAFLLFRESLGQTALLGMAVAVLGVALVTGRG